MSKVDDYITRTARTTLEDWDQDFDILLEQDGFATLSIRMNPVKAITHTYVVRFDNADGDIVEQTSRNFKTAFSLYRRAISFCNNQKGESA
jgi:hypothetical protein